MTTVLNVNKPAKCITIVVDADRKMQVFDDRNGGHQGQYVDLRLFSSSNELVYDIELTETNSAS